MIEVRSPPASPLGEPSTSRIGRAGRKPSRPQARASGPKGFQFIASDAAGKPSEDTRKSIRSHVMRGKNTRKRCAIYSKANQPPKPDDDQAATPSDESSSSSSQALTKRRGMPITYNHGFAIVPGDHGTWRSVTFPWPSGPGKTIQDVHLMQFPEVLDNHTQGLLFRFFTAIKETMYPVQWCFRPECTQTVWFQWLFSDLAYFYSTMFIVSSFQDLFHNMKQRPSNAVPAADLSSRFTKRTVGYLRSSIELLQKRLNDPTLQIEDVTIATVVSLAMVADAMGDADSIRTHVNGLKQIVRMRGGVRAIMGNRHVLAKICRVDLSFSLKYGEPPEFYSNDMSWEPALYKTLEVESSVPPKPASAELQKLINGLDPRLRNVFNDMRAFASITDGLVESTSKLRPELFEELMTSIQYRLLLLQYDVESQPIEEAIRLGLLAFQTSIFLQMHGTRAKYAYIGEKLTKAIQVLPETSPVLVQLKTWVVFIGACAVLDSNDPWLVGTVRRLTLESSWFETRELLEEVMWINVVHGAAGKEVYDGSRVVHDTMRLGLGRFWTEFLGVE